jgi:hypothetical protein
MASSNSTPISPIPVPAPQNSLPPSRSTTRQSDPELISPTPSHRTNPITFRPHQEQTYDARLNNILRDLHMAPELFVELSSQLLSELGIGTSDLKYPQQFMSSIQHLMEDYDNGMLPARYRQPLLRNGRLARLRHLYSELSLSSSARSLTNPRESGASFHIHTPRIPDTPPSQYSREWNPQQLQEQFHPTDTASPQNQTSYPSNRWYGSPASRPIQERLSDRPRTPERSRSLFSPLQDAPIRSHTQPSTPALSYTSAPRLDNSTQAEIIPPSNARYSSPGPDNTTNNHFNAFTPSFHHSRGNGTFERHVPPHQDNAHPDTQYHSRRSRTPSHHSQSHRSHSHTGSVDHHRSNPPSNLPPTRDQSSIPMPQTGYPNSFPLGTTGPPPPPFQNTGPPVPMPTNPLNNLLTIESKIEVRKPDPFDGTNPRKWKTFLTECMITFQAKPNTYQNEQHRVAFASSWLKGNPLTHFSSLLTHNPQHPALFEWIAFTSEFGRLFGPVNNAHCSRCRI